MKNTSFGSYEKVSDDPLTIKYTIADGVNWSDGTPVDAADLLLHWAALSRALDTPDFDPTEFTDPDTGEYTDAFPTDVVYFDSGATPDSRFGLVHDTPEISDDGKSITLVYSAPFVDWELAFGLQDEILPAHVVAQERPRHRGQRRGQAGRRRRHPERGRRRTRADLELLEHAASTSPSCRTTPSCYLASGPYMISDFVADQYITLTANPEYKGDNAAEHRGDHGPLHPRPARPGAGARER